MADVPSRRPHDRFWPILLQKSLATLLNNDSVALKRFAVEAIDDGAASITTKVSFSIRFVLMRPFRTITQLERLLRFSTFLGYTQS